MTSNRYKARIQTSKAHLEIEARNVIAKVAPRPLAEVMEILRQRGIPMEREFVESVWKEKQAK